MRPSISPTGRLTRFLPLGAALVLALAGFSFSNRANVKSQLAQSFQDQSPQLSPTPEEADDVVRVSTDLVVVNVTVLDKNGTFVTGLKRGTFRFSKTACLSESQRSAQRKRRLQRQSCWTPTGSMESRMTLGRSAAIRFLDGLRDEDVAAVYSFDVKVEQWSDFSPGPRSSATCLHAQDQNDDCAQ
jgi:hypothetical protein